MCAHLNINVVLKNNIFNILYQVHWSERESQWPRKQKQNKN